MKSNHHLTELTRMTFKKSDPTIVTLYFKDGLTEEGEQIARARVYHMENKQDFIVALRTNMRRYN